MFPSPLHYTRHVGVRTMLPVTGSAGRAPVWLDGSAIVVPTHVLKDSTGLIAERGQYTSVVDNERSRG